MNRNKLHMILYFHRDQQYFDQSDSNIDQKTLNQTRFSIFKKKQRPEALKTNTLFPRLS